MRWKTKIFNVLYHRATLDHLAELNGPVRDFDIPETKAQLLGSRLHQQSLLEDGVNMASRPSNTAKYSSVDGDPACCNDACVLMGELQLAHRSEQWRLFIDSSKVSLKTVLLHDGKERSAIPLAHAVHTKVTYFNF